MHSRIVKILALLIGMEACLVMAGWVFGIQSLTRILPIGINMKFPTAFVFFLSAIGLYCILMAVKYNYELPQIILPGIAIIIFLIMGEILVAYLTGGFTGIDALFINKNGDRYSAGSGLPALNTIASFILFGAACLYVLFPESKTINKLRIFGFFIFMIGFISVTGYVVGLPMLYFQFNNSSVPMAFNTALSFTLLGYGLIIISKIKKTNES